MKKHGQRVGDSKTLTYVSWQEMKRRCTQPHRHNYANYGGRGIKVCDRWLKSFTAFFEDMGRRPSRWYTLDRKDPNGNYEPSNCKWSTRIAQANNKCAGDLKANVLRAQMGRMEATV